MSENLRIIFAGTPEIARVALAKMLDSGFKPGLVFTQPDRPSGRGMKLTASPVKLLAESNEIEVIQPLSFKKNPEALQKIVDFSPDIIVVVAYGLILPQALLDIPKRGCINIHVSLLPRWRGAAPIQRAILAGDLVSGVTIMQMDAGLDTGDILLTSEIQIVDQETSGSLHDKLAKVGAELLIKYLTTPDSYPKIKQPEINVSYAHKIEKDEAKIDWAQDASTIARKIRGYNPFPGAFTFLDGQLHKIWLARIGGEDKFIPLSNKLPGTIVKAQSDKLSVLCGNGTILEIQEIQEAGSKRKLVQIYLQGKSDLNGKKFGGK